MKKINIEEQIKNGNLDPDKLKPIGNVMIHLTDKLNDLEVSYLVLRLFESFNDSDCEIGIDFSNGELFDKRK